MKLYRITNTNTGFDLEVHAGTRRVALNRVLDNEALYSSADNANETLLTLCIADLGTVIKMHILAVDFREDHECNREGCTLVTDHDYMVKQSEMNSFMATNPRALTGNQYKKVNELAWRMRMRLDDAIRRDTDVMKLEAAIELGLRQDIRTRPS